MLLRKRIQHLSYNYYELSFYVSCVYVCVCMSSYFVQHNMIKCVCFIQGVVRELSHKTTAHITYAKEICNHLSEIHNIEIFSVHVEDIG